MLGSTTRHQLKRVSVPKLATGLRYSSSSTSTTDDQTQELTNTTKRQGKRISATNASSSESKKSVPVPTTTFLSASDIISNPSSTTAAATATSSTSTVSTTTMGNSDSAFVEQIIIDEVSIPIGQDKSLSKTEDGPSKKKYLMSSLPRVPSTENIPKNRLLLDMLMSNYSPLTTPIVTNHTRSPVSLALNPKQYKNQKITSSQTSILENIDKFKRCKQELKELESQRFKNYNPYFTATSMKPNANVSSNNNNINSNSNPNIGFSDGRNAFNSIFTNSILNTQQHNTELFNLPLHYLEKLKPFQVMNKPGDEHYRDDMLVVKKIEIEEKNLRLKEERMENFAKKLQDAKNGVFKGGRFDIEDIHEYFGFK